MSDPFSYPAKLVCRPGKREQWTPPDTRLFVWWVSLSANVGTVWVFFVFL